MFGPEIEANPHNHAPTLRQSFVLWPWHRLWISITSRSDPDTLLAVASKKEYSRSSSTERTRKPT